MAELSSLYRGPVERDATLADKTNFRLGGRADWLETYKVEAVMADHALFIGWNRPIPGREGGAMEAFQSGLAYFAKKVEAGEIESFEPVVLAAHGGDMNGFILVRGDSDKLTKLRDSDEFLDMMGAVR